MDIKKTVQIRFSQCDSAGVLFFAKIFEITHDLYEEWVQEALFQEHSTWFANDHWAVPICHCEADYKKPMKQGHFFEVSLQVLKVGNSSFSFKWSYLQKEDIFCAVKTNHVFIDKKSGAPIPIPQEIKSKLLGFTP